jgi:exonuclease III
MIMIYCHNNKNISDEYIPTLSIAPLGLLTVVKICEIVRCKILITRWLFWLQIIVSSSKMLSLTIYLELLRQNIESNPGFSTENKNSEHSKILSVYSYNSNGLGDRKKLRRILAKVSPIVEKGGVILIQETHLNDTSYLKTVWKYNFVSNCIRSNSAGVIILYNNEYKTLDTFSDEKGRNIIVAIENDDVKLIISNAYFPNDHKEGIVFAEGMYLKILEFQHKFPEHQTIAGGDFNTCMSTTDSLNRNNSTVEKCLSETITMNNKITKLSNAYRFKHKEGGYTWKRGSCYSRLDYIFVATSLLSKISNAKVDWAFESSDHAAVKINFKVEKGPVKGPGIAKVNASILNDPNIVKQIGKELEDMMKQTDHTWGPHAKLEFLKVAIRSVFSSKVAEVRKQINNEIVNLEDEINQLENFKVEILTAKEINSVEKSEKFDLAIHNLKGTLISQRNKLVDSQSFKSKAKWFEYGEKSNKFFLNLLKTKQNNKLISSITNDKEIFVGQEEVSKGITSFYRKLYSKDQINRVKDDDFYKYCPKLTLQQAESMDSELTMVDLLNALKTCKDSAPGPDGIPYSVYKKFWGIAGPIILEAWKYSAKNQSLPPSHYESIITLLPKEGKDTGDIKNWRPITLSNCDAKIITKALSIKVSKVLDSILDPAQTAYVPGRSVADNLRANFYMKNYCLKNNVNSVLISLDAKKAFDSVDHKYIECTLRAYGFGEGFINIFKTLYKDIKARILINGFQSESIDIKRGVKQGDALSCAIFIICIKQTLCFFIIKHSSYLLL